MSEARRSFWSSVPGLVTGLAGLLTAIVGLVAVLIQLGVIGGKDSDTAPGGTGGTSITAPATGGAPGSGPTTTELPTFDVKPTTLDFPPSDTREKTVTVTNTSRTATLSSVKSTFSGSDPDRFSVSGGTCAGASVPANATCTLKVTFTPPTGAALKKYSAALRVSAAGAAGVEVNLTASTLLS